MDNITPLRPVATGDSTPQSREYNVYLKIGDKVEMFGPFDGFLVTNGYIVCILERHNDVDTVQFMANQGDVCYVEENLEVSDET